jgi:Peptidase family M23
VIALRTLLAAATLATLAGGLLGCRNDQAPPPRYPPPPPPIPGAPVVYYKFPFLGKWRVQRVHYGAPQPDQTYALDLVPDAPIGDKTQNTGYPCYNQPVVASAAGLVAIAVDGVPDNQPGVRNGYSAHGNYVVVDHRNGEFSLVAHLIPGSLKVRVGTPVSAGMELGRCGNSGNSTLPHIHWQIMDNMQPNIARGIQPRYAPYTRNGSASVDLPQPKETLENK